jgi:sugar phosphate isomerase/epimerase
MAPLNAEGPSLQAVQEFGLRACQLVSWEPELWTQDVADRIAQEHASSDVVIAGFWAGWSGPAVWDLVQGPDTLGIVPERFREKRKEYLIRAGRFASRIDTSAVITHLGFIPENCSDPRFKDVVETVREIASDLLEVGLEFWFETGQETPVTLLRLIQEVGTPNLGINLDPANLILYGKGNPIDALGVFGKHVKNVHAKDGCYPTDPMKTGNQVRVGDGQVDFPKFLRRLEEIGYSGELIIEREIAGPEQIRDIRYTVDYLKVQLGR